MNIDQVVTILARTIFHPKGAWGLAAGGYMRDKMQPGWLTILAVTWATLVSMIRILSWANRRWISLPLYKLSPQNDVVVITGAARGLGLLIAAFFNSRGFRTVTMDIEPLSIPLAGNSHLSVNVADENAVQDAFSIVRSEIGTPTVLVNCAGVAIGGTTENMTPKHIRKVIDINFFGSLWAAKECIPGMKSLQRGCIVNVSSSTAFVGPAKAGIYAASKAAVRTNHEAMRHELAATGIKMILVTPGQLDTAMFSKVRSPDPFWAPIVPAADLADEVVQWILDGKSGEILRPFYSQILPIMLSLLPQSIVDVLRSWNGLDKAMDPFVASQLHADKG